MYHREVLDDLFGSEFWDEVVARMVATTVNTKASAEDKLDNCLAYLKARATLDDPNGSLVCNLGPDEAWHVLILYTAEYTRLCDVLCGVYLHHDPAEHAALVNSREDTQLTLAAMARCGIRYTPALWRDHLYYPRGAVTLRSSFVPAEQPVWVTESIRIGDE